MVHLVSFPCRAHVPPLETLLLQPSTLQVARLAPCLEVEKRERDGRTYHMSKKP